MKEILLSKKPKLGALGQFVADLPWGEEQTQPETQIVIEGDRKVHAHLKIDRIGKQRKEAESYLAKFLPKSAVKELLDGENKLFEWLGKDKGNPTRFAFDPLACLAEAGIKLDGKAGAMLGVHRGDQKRVQGAASLKDLASLRISVAGAEPKPGK